MPGQAPRAPGGWGSHNLETIGVIYVATKIKGEVTWNIPDYFLSATSPLCKSVNAFIEQAVMQLHRQRFTMVTNSGLF
jgi:hypothetical protein